ncbi:MAG: LysM peptidoglycan-binding domain-containing protein, partial [Acidimicrobiaceae bacterium]|nr:LysM peptidoglycan-binding domain-containing protein [Acidimicrobiaceae bacterium]
MSARTVTRILAGAAGIALVAAAGQASFSGLLTSSTPVYEVQPGDTLWGIASVDGLTVNQIAGANGISADSMLQVGQVLKIPAASYVPGSDPSTPTSATATSSSSSPASPTLVNAPTPPGSFCATFPTPGGSEPLPRLLSLSPSRLSLRPFFVEWANFYGVTPSLVEAIAWQESGWQEDVVSPDGAVGIG